jgi:hypothetical protein
VILAGGYLALKHSVQLDSHHRLSDHHDGSLDRSPIPR